MEETFDETEEVGLCSSDFRLLLLLLLLLLPPLLIPWRDCCKCVDGGGVDAFIREVRGEYAFVKNGIGLGFGDWDGEISSSPDMERFNCFLLLLPGVDDDEFVLLWLLLLLLLLLLLFPLLLIPCKFPLLLLLFGVGGRLRCL